MSRVYAGILGTLAMAVVLCRGAMNFSGAEATLTMAAISLVIFATLGAILGHIAQSTVDESVRSRLEQQLTHHAGGGAEEATA
jgi:MFS-type transporter involved in bile tolerance (Atg22 family)